MATVAGRLRILERGQAGYEEARLASVWNGRKPDRFPAAIVQVRDAEDVGAAVRLARERGLQVTVRSGGHGWSANHLRDDALLLDLSALTSIEVDEPTQTAWVQPAVKGEQLIRELRGHGLFFTTGHCNDVGLGGFTLGGGFGWMSRRHGFACTSLLAADVVTAEGELVRADRHQHTDLLWAARGSGPGFPGVVTRLHFQVYPDYPVTLLSAQIYPRELLDELFQWLDGVAGTLPDGLELRVNVSRELPGTDGVAMRLLGSSFAHTREEAEANLAVLDACPLRDRALSSMRHVEADVLDLVMASDDACKPGRRMVADNLWFGAPMAELLPGIRRIADTMTHESFLMWHVIGADPTPSDDGFFTLHDRYNAAIYAVWDDPAEDDVVAAWPHERMAEMEHLASGIQLNDENLLQRPGPVATPAATERLAAIRAARDPERRFHTWMSPDPEGAS